MAETRETKTFKKIERQRKTRVAKFATATQAIGKIEKGSDTFVLTYGQFSLIDALMVVLDQTGPAHVAISTWTAAHAHLDKSAELLESADILSFRMIVDRSFKTRQPKYYAQMMDTFGVDSIRAINTHAKFITVRNDSWDIVVRTSMNLNENPRLENIEISENADFADFFEKIVNDVWEEVGIEENKADQLELRSLEETVDFPLVESKSIKRRNLNEARYTHQIDKDGQANLWTSTPQDSPENN